MRIGTTLGPYKGAFWIDPEAHTLTIRHGREGISGEVSIKLNPDKIAEILDAMLPSPIRIKNGHVPDGRFKRNIVVDIEEAKKKERPKTIQCKDCEREVQVKPYGKVPEMCPACRFRA